MELKNDKLFTILKSILLPILLLISIACFLYYYISKTILSELLKKTAMPILKVETINYFILEMKYSIIIAMALLIVSTALILFKLAYDNSKVIHMDYLTQIGNRRLFDIKLKENIKKVKISNNKLSIMMIDIDFFKEINDKYGYDIGDLILKHVAKKIEINTRKMDICSRYGGDEFIIILPDTNGDQAKLIGKRIMKSLNNFSFSMDTNNLELIKVTVSIGISEWKNGMTFSEFTKLVDNALHISKSEGRNRITLLHRDCY